VQVPEHAALLVVEEPHQVRLVADRAGRDRQIGLQKHDVHVGTDPLSDGSTDRQLDFWELPGTFERTLTAASQLGPIAYVEAEFFAGSGTQGAIVWADRQVILGPLTNQEMEPTPPAGTPISQALRVLGVASTGHIDEFAAVGLYAHRDTEEWLG
jgi:hypothetical protein